MLARLWITSAMLGHKPAGRPGVIHRFLKDLVGAIIFSHTGAMNNTHWHSDHQLYPLPTAPAHPAQPIGVRPPHETNKLNPYGLTALVMVLLMICIGFVNLIFFNWELSIVLPTGFTWLGAMGFGIGALFMKNREKITAIIALILGVLVIVSVPLIAFLAVTFIMWVSGAFA